VLAGKQRFADPTVGVIADSDLPEHRSGTVVVQLRNGKGKLKPHDRFRVGSESIEQGIYCFSIRISKRRRESYTVPADLGLIASQQLFDVGNAQLAESVQGPRRMQLPLGRVGF
tara:strand:- start:10 stop:351 length:342 start_codon:yes stop_codon:yes gene_type:complete